MKRSLLLLNLVFFLFIVISIFWVTSRKPVYPDEMIHTLPQRKVYTGAWVGGFWDSKTKSLNTKQLKEFENTIGNKRAGFKGN